MAQSHSSIPPLHILTLLTELKNPVHLQKNLTRAITLGVSATAITLTFTPSCSERKKATTKEVTTESVNLDEEDDKKEGKAKTAFQTLDILPEGSILRRVRLPRYDKDFNPISLFVADKLTVIDQNHIEAEGIKIELYDENGKVHTRTKMNRAIYNPKDSTLTAKEAVWIRGERDDPSDDSPRFEASGTGLIFDWNSGSGFLLGPASTLFHIKKSDSQKKTTPSKK